MYLKYEKIHRCAKIRQSGHGKSCSGATLVQLVCGDKVAGKKLVPERINRKESQARTRERLIAVGRAHFLRDGLSGATAEQIAEEAGFTRGALYANFSGKEDLFLAIIQSSVDAELQHLQSILHSSLPPRERLRLLRETFGNLAINQEWVLLEAELQTHALRHPAIREAFRQHLQQRIADAAELLRATARDLGHGLRATPEQITMVMGSLLQGLAVRLAVLKEDPQEMRELAMKCFDLFLVEPPEN